MCYLGSILLIFLEEYQAFNCFINLTHSYHFLAFLIGDMIEVFY